MTHNHRKISAWCLQQDKEKISAQKLENAFVSKQRKTQTQETQNHRRGGGGLDPLEM